MLELTSQNLIGMTHSALIDQMIKFNIIYNTGCTIMKYKINQEILTFSGNKMGSYYFGKRFVIRGSENRHKIQLIKVIFTFYITEHFHD